MKNVEYAFFLTAFAATIGALILTAVNEASFNISQVLLTFALVLITCIYAMRTAAIANATKEQAEASVKMAEETRQQRYSESLPLLAPTTPQIWTTQGLVLNEALYQYLQSSIGIYVIWCNVGKGVAINSRFSFWTAPTFPRKATFFPPRDSGTLEVKGEKKVDYSKILDDGQLCDIPELYHPRLVAEYQDIYERKVTTVQEFRIEEENGNKRAFLGDLYFTVNGKRLGEEVIKND